MGRSSSGKQHPVKVSKERLDEITQLLSLDLGLLVRGEVDNYLTHMLQFVLQLILNTEVLEKAGKRYERDLDRDCVRWASQASSGFILGQKVAIMKPRLRTRDLKAEVPLDTADLLKDREALNEKTAQKLLLGLSTRRLADTIDGLLQERGVGRQSISWRGIEAMTAKLEEFQNRNFRDLDLVAIFIDGVHIGDQVHVVAVGIDTGGKKHVLAMQPGETEDHVICKALLASLIDRGLSEVGGYLFIIDGSKALRKAIKQVYHNRVAVQRCLEHKKRNLERYLPKNMHQEVRHKMQAAFSEETLAGAEAKFHQLREELSMFRQSAAKSLLDGLGELLTLHRLGVTGALRKSLCTTNGIESIFSSARYYTRNVKRWRKEEQAERWLAAGLLEAEVRLKPIHGYTALKKLKQNLLKLTEVQ